MRRKNVSTFIRGLVALGLCLPAAARDTSLPTDHHPTTDFHEGWRLGVQAWTFRKYTFFEAVDKAAALGLDWIEAYPNQNIGGPYPDQRFRPNMPEEARATVKQKLQDAGVRLVNYGVTGVSEGVFEFARDMGVETIVSEPPQDSLDDVEKLCRQYGIRVAIHNHPEPSRYWNPETVLEACRGRGGWIGACADTGHWVRSGIDPLEAIKMLDGHIVSLHFKDIKDGHDVPWGTGEGRAEEILRELHRQGFRGVFSIEYEHHWTSSMPEIRESVRFFRRVAGDLEPGGWRDLLDGNLEAWRTNWELQEGVLTAKPGGFWSMERFGNFVLDLEFKLAPKTNSGVFLRTDKTGNWLHTGIEVQILDSHGRKKPGKHDCGAVYDCLAPSVNAVKPPGEWNHYTITCMDNKIYVILNGRQIIDMDLDRWTEPHRNPDGTKNKFNNAYKDMPRQGHIGLQWHGHPIWFRNIMIKPLDGQPG